MLITCIELENIKERERVEDSMSTNRERGSCAPAATAVVSVVVVAVEVVVGVVLACSVRP